LVQIEELAERLHLLKQDMLQFSHADPKIVMVSSKSTSGINSLKRVIVGLVPNMKTILGEYRRRKEAKMTKKLQENIDQGTARESSSTRSSTLSSIMLNAQLDANNTSSGAESQTVPPRSPSKASNNRTYSPKDNKRQLKSNSGRTSTAARSEDTVKKFNKLSASKYRARTGLKTTKRKSTKQ